VIVFTESLHLRIIEHDLYRKLKTEGVHFSSSTKSGPVRDLSV
jgi:hypothetical protein